jgi:MYXO-CTERM domain-containing protein
MKRIAWILLAGVILVAAAQAAYVEINAPDKVNVGQPLEVTGSSTLKPGFSTDLIFYKVATTKTEVDRTRIVVQEGGVFATTFPTMGLTEGSYLLELVDPKPEGSEQFSGESKTQKNVALIDRQKELTITSPYLQPFTGLLSIRGSVSTAGNNGTQLKVDHNGAIIYGPLYIATLNNAFSTDISISEGGTFNTFFSDNKGYIGSAQFTVSQPVVTTAATTVTTAAPTVTVTAQASRNQPAYFSVDTRPGQVILATSSGIDWVMEYIDENGQLTVVNEKGTLGGESVTFTARGGTVSVKVYPFTFSDQGSVTLSATNADSATVCTTCGALFTTTQAPTPTKESPLPAFLALLALAVLVMARRR